MDISLWAYLKDFGSLSVVFAPIFAVSLVESQASLQTWRAAKLVSPPQQGQSGAGSSGLLNHELKAAKRKYWKGLALYMGVLIYLLCASMSVLVVSKINAAKLDDRRFVGLYFASITPPFVYIVATSISIALRLYDKVLFRGDKQKLFMIHRRSEDWNSRNVALVYTFSVAIVLGAIILQSKVLASILCASIAHTITAIDMPRSFKAKPYVFSSVAMALYFAYFAPVLTEGGDFYHAFPAEGFFKVDWPSLPFGSVILSTPLQFISACYRFDHIACARDAIDDLDNVPSSTLEPAGTMVTVAGTASAFKPSSSLQVSRAFVNKPYFLSALAGWMLTIAATAALKALEFDVATYFMLGLYSVLIAPLLMAVMVASTAIARGEAREIWNYKEEWEFVGEKVEAASGLGQDSTYEIKDILTNEESPLVR